MSVYLIGYSSRSKGPKFDAPIFKEKLKESAFDKTSRLSELPTEENYYQFIRIYPIFLAVLIIGGIVGTASQFDKWEFGTYTLYLFWSS